jgi:hypothetical protein
MREERPLTRRPYWLLADDQPVCTLCGSTDGVRAVYLHLRTEQSDTWCHVCVGEVEAYVETAKDYLRAGRQEP